MSQLQDSHGIEADIARRLVRRPAPADFAGGVMAAIREGKADRLDNVVEFRPRLKMKVLSALAAAAALIIGFGVQRQIQLNEAAQLAEAEVAEAHLIESLELAGVTFNRARDAAFGVGTLDVR